MINMGRFIQSVIFNKSHEYQIVGGGFFKHVYIFRVALLEVFLVGASRLV